MAQTKSKSKRQPASKSAGSSTKAKAKSRSKPKAKSKPKASKPKATKKAAKPKAASKSKSSNGARSSNGSSGGSSPVEAVRNAVGDVGDKAKDAGQSVGKAASKAKVPLVAGGAAIAGAAGGLALAASKGGRKKGLKSLKGAMPGKPKVKIKSKDLVNAAKEVGKVSAQVGEIADGIQRAQDSSNGNGKHRSPIEVVLQGLTARR
jgi:hypothetical protein